MNLVYRLIFNKAQGCWQAVAEIARSRAGSGRATTAGAARVACQVAPPGGGIRSIAVAIAAMFVAAGPATAAPGGAGGKPVNPVLWAGAGGADGTGGMGAVNDTDSNAHGGNGGNATPAGPTAGADASIGTLGTDPSFVGGQRRRGRGWHHGVAEWGPWTG
ncbi:ESPR domain-containing protein [Variovorax robiniae]|uniref:ESPR domain-containing protein n=1 Tax=Variovorax robiniae TaxID=1836199 RepID=A0ABU8XGK7_9BURK